MFFELMKFLTPNIQKDVYSSERCPQLKKDLRLTTQADNILRCEGRLKNAPISYDSRFPIFIPKGTFAKLLVNCYHVHHNGLKETLNEIRTSYWIPKARYFIQQIIQKCRTCKRIEGKTYIYPDSPSLPVARLSESPPFTFTGLDYAGPVHVRNMYNSSTITYKAWKFLFTCSTTRAVCLDLVPDCSAQACIRGLKRFFSRRGVPQSILSDNGSKLNYLRQHSMFCGHLILLHLLGGEGYSKGWFVQRKGFDACTLKLGRIINCSLRN